MKTVLLFDLDGVLVDSRELHFTALNLALSEVGDEYVISQEEQAKFYEGLTTKEKLKILTTFKDLNPELYEAIWKSKQEHTSRLFEDIAKDDALVELFKFIKSKKISIGVVSNSIRKTLDVCLLKLGIIDYVDYSISNEDVTLPKPSPEGYLKAMLFLGGDESTTAIFEDSEVGREAAKRTGAKLVEVNNRSDLTKDLVTPVIEQIGSEPTFNLLVPMAGAGSRFAEAGYDKPKPLIEVNGKPMIQQVVYSVDMNGNFIYLAQAEHEKTYELSTFLRRITPQAPSVKVVEVDGLTEGAASTTLLAKDLIDNNSPLVIFNSDQLVEWDSPKFLKYAGDNNLDGCIAVFESNEPKWSYAKTDEDGFVTEVAEKQVISDTATVGIYYWKHGSDYVKYAEQMIANNKRVNGEFYVCPVYNEAIADGKKIGVYKVDTMIGLGTPEDLEAYVGH